MRGFLRGAIEAPARGFWILELVGMLRSAAMHMVGHKTESIYRRYAITDAEALRFWHRTAGEAP